MRTLKSGEVIGMFKTFDQSSFKAIDTEEISKGESRHIYDNELPQNKVKCKRFLGASARSSEGCMNCRTRK